MLNKAQEMVDRLKATSSTNEKIEILGDYETIKDLLVYVYSPFTQFNVTSANLEKRQDLIQKTDITLFDLLDKLNSREVTGHAAIALANGFIANNYEYKDLIYNIIDKNLKTRTDAKLVNKAFGPIVPTFNVALADEYSKKKKFVDFSTQKWYASQKLDGCRCIIIKDKTVKAFSRQGKEFFTLDNLLGVFKSETIPAGVYDGEICIVDEKGNENFASIMKEIRRKDHTIELPRFKVFDYLSFKEFNSCDGSMLSIRQEKLRAIFATKISDYIDVVKQIPVKNEEHLGELTAEAEKSGWEGLIIREDVPYEGKRSRHMLKVKSFHDAEFTVLDTYNTVKRMFVNGIEKEVDCMGGVTIEYKGYKVDCGSGWSDEERVFYFSHPDEIIGKIITVQWFEETTNKEGTTSLRFPTKKYIHGEKRDT